MKLIITIDAELRQLLEKMSKEKKVSMASFIRTLILEESKSSKLTQPSD